MSQFVIPITKEMEIDNMGAMPRGLNARYLEVTLSHHEPPRFIAWKWRRKPPLDLLLGHRLIDFKPESK